MASSTATRGETWPHFAAALAWSLWTAGVVVALVCVARYVPRRTAAVLRALGLVALCGVLFASVTVALHHFSRQDVGGIALVAALGRVPMALSAALLGLLPLVFALAVCIASDGLQYWVAALGIAQFSVPALLIVMAVTALATLVRKTTTAARTLGAQGP